MKCSKCGKEVQKEWKFCNYCGEEINTNVNIQKEKIKKQDEHNGNLNKEVNQNAIGGMLFGAFIYIGVAIIIFLIFKLYFSNNSIDYDKRQMLGTLQNYSTTNFTVDDFKIEKVEKTKTYRIYRVNVSKSNYLISGSFYVLLYCPYGNSNATEILLNKNLSDLKEILEDY